MSTKLPSTHVPDEWYDLFKAAARTAKMPLYKFMVLCLSRSPEVQAEFRKAGSPAMPPLLPPSRSGFKAQWQRQERDLEIRRNRARQERESKSIIPNMWGGQSDETD